MGGFIHLVQLDSRTRQAREQITQFNEHPAGFGLVQAAAGACFPPIITITSKAPCVVGDYVLKKMSQPYSV